MIASRIKLDFRDDSTVASASGSNDAISLRHLLGILEDPS